ncbi:MAG: ribbon-helix-helix protein, CopG family [Anaerolineales bacterium]|nr:ribbon-helix-helix protein, CopG family [Anaerolineales bacterium]
MRKKRIQNPPNVAMRLSEADKRALRLVAQRMGKSQTEAVRVLVRERLAKYQPSAGTMTA